MTPTTRDTLAAALRYSARDVRAVLALPPEDPAARLLRLEVVAAVLAEAAEAALAAPPLEVRRPEPGEVWSFDDGSEVLIVNVAGEHLVLRELPSGPEYERSGLDEFLFTYKLARRRPETVALAGHHDGEWDVSIDGKTLEVDVSDETVRVVEMVATALGARVVRK